MPSKKPDLENRIKAIISRAQGTPYEDVLSEYGVTPNQFYRHVMFDMEKFVELSNKRERRILSQIISNLAKRDKLFEMSEEFLKQQYNRVVFDRMIERIPGEKEVRYYNGTCNYLGNMRTIVYYGLSSFSPLLASANREDVIQGIRSLRKSHLEAIGLGGIMEHVRHSRLEILKLFDEAYQRRTGDKSLFDVTKEPHLNELDETSRRPIRLEKQRNFINSIMDRMQGLSYEQVLLTYNISPNQFYRAVMNIEDLIGFTRGATRRSLKEIATKPAKRYTLFEMSDEFLKRQYDRIMRRIPGEKQKRFYNGTFNHRENIRSVVFYALTSNSPKLSETGSAVQGYNRLLASKNREEVIRGIRGLGRQLKDYFDATGLGGIMRHLGNSPLEIIKLFDEAYQRRTGDKSLFDVTKELHLNEWGETFQTPNKYYKDPEKVEGAFYHGLSGNHEKLGSRDRAVVVKGLDELPKALQVHFKEVGLWSVLINGFKGQKGKEGSPRAGIEAYDRAYQRVVSDISLFSDAKRPYVEFKGNRLVAHY